jgi:flagellar basal body-associated protein FliL
MARHKQTFSQQIIGLVTYVMPAPVRQVLTSRWVSLLIVVVVPILIASGVVSLSWNGSRPGFSLNERRAEQVEREAEQETLRAAKELRSLQDARRR